MEESFAPNLLLACVFTIQKKGFVIRHMHSCSCRSSPSAAAQGEWHLLGGSCVQQLRGCVSERFETWTAMRMHMFLYRVTYSFQDLNHGKIWLSIGIGWYKIVSSGDLRRRNIFPEGDLSRPFVQDGNSMADSRMNLQFLSLHL